MDDLDIDKFVSLEELIRRTREILWKMPAARRSVEELEAEAEQNGRTCISIFNYLFEVHLEVFGPAVEGDDDVVKSYLGICEELLGMNSGLVRESIEDFAAKPIIRDYPHLIPQGGPRLKELAAAY